jgi:hypothetical protein
MYRLDEKLANIRAGNYTRRDFIIADAKDPDMGPSISGNGFNRAKDGSYSRYATRGEFVERIRAIVKQDIVDIMLTSVTVMEALIDAGVYRGSRVKPAIRANDTTDVWVGRGCRYAKQPSRPFRTASLSRVITGSIDPAPGAPVTGTDLGLYSITFTNDLDADYASLSAFSDFRYEASLNNFKYFLEVFNPNVDCGLDAAAMPFFVNDCIIRCLSGVSKADMPQFLKIAYNGPRAMEELASFDSRTIVGILGGGAGTARDCFELLHQAEKYGARVALFGRKINQAEDPLSMVVHMRRVADGEMTSLEAVKSYHAGLARDGYRPLRDVETDCEVTEEALKAGL